VEVQKTVPTATQQFHTYGVELMPTKIIWTVDGQPYGTYDKPSGQPQDWPFGSGNRFYVILNLAMGGDGGGAIDDGQGPWQMQIEKINFYEYTGPR
jgi:beta-glucanase (GH16 family)